MSRPRLVRVCRCGRHYYGVTYKAKAPSSHFECPTCERIGVRIVAAIALELEGMPIGEVIARFALGHRLDGVDVNVNEGAAA